MSFNIGDQVRTQNGIDAVIFDLGYTLAYLNDMSGNYLGVYRYEHIQKAPRLLVELINPNAKLPTYGDGYAAGMDIYATESFTIPPRSKVNVPSGIKCNIPAGHYLIIKSRSGTAWKNSIEASNAGVIDQNYRKEIGVILYNNSDVPYHVVQGDRIAQMILQKFERANIVLGAVEDDTNRGGFGSTGK